MIRRSVGRRRGVVLIAVLLVVAMLSLSAYTFTHWLTVEAEVATVEGRRIQARYLAESGVALVDALAILNQSGHPVPTLENNTDLFEGICVLTGETDTAEEAMAVGGTAATAESSGTDGFQASSAYGRFCVVNPEPFTDRLSQLDPDKQMVRYGPERESGKIHVNFWFQEDPEALARALLELPGATEELVDAILDWLDADDETRPGGAETEDYETLPEQIVCRNGPLETIEELLLVRGMTTEILFGEDLNRNGQLDPNEKDGATSPPLDDEDDELNRGWWPHLTLFSRDSNTDHRGRRKIDLNDPNLGRLYGQLLREFDKELVWFVIAHRVIGPGDGAEPSLEGPPLPEPGKFPFRSVLDLIDARIDGQWEGDPVQLESPLRRDEPDFAQMLDHFLDRLTAGPPRAPVGRIDIFSASVQALAVLPVLSEEQRSAIIENRPVSEPTGGGLLSFTDESDAPPASIGWLLVEEIVTLEELVELEPYITAQSPVIRFQAIGFGDADRTWSRLEVVLDRGSRPPRVLSWSTLDAWGAVYPLPLLGQGAEPKALPALGGTAEGSF